MASRRIQTMYKFQELSSNPDKERIANIVYNLYELETKLKRYATLASEGKLTPLQEKRLTESEEMVKIYNQELGFGVSFNNEPNANYILFKLPNDTYNNMWDHTWRLY
jgi:hypothetical protein